MKLKALIREADKEWRGKDLIKIKQLMILTRKKEIAARNSGAKLRTLISSYKDHEQGMAFIPMIAETSGGWGPSGIKFLRCSSSLESLDRRRIHPRANEAVAPSLARGCELVQTLSTHSSEILPVS